MKKLSLALALGAGISAASAFPSTVRASGMSTVTTVTPTTTTTTPSIQTLNSADMSSAQFNSLFTPVDTAQKSSIDFYGAPGSGTLTSQVFAGGMNAATGQNATGLYAYAYQVSVNNVTNTSGEPTHVDAASWQFNATPTGSALTSTTSPVYAYNIKDGAVGGFAMPTAANSAMGVREPSISWQPGMQIGSIRANFVNPSTGASALTPGDTSATFVVISSQPPSTNFQYAGVLSSNPQQGAPAVYSPTAGVISPVPVPEPTTFLAWAGMAGAAVLVRRTRNSKKAARLA